MTTAESTPVRRQSFGEIVSYAALGPARTLLVLLVVVVVFTALTPVFLTPINLNNLLLQVTAVATISVGIVMVLLLGEIDLSAGAVSGLTASIMGVLVVNRGWSPILGILAALAAGALIGLVQGSIVTFLRLPSFIVTLAGLLTWQGFHLAVLGSTGTINIKKAFITGITGVFLPAGVSIAIAVLATVGYTWFLLRRRRRRRALQLPKRGLVSEVVVPAAGLLVGLCALLLITHADRGIGLAVVLVLVLAMVMSVILASTRYGQHIYAVGGNPDAAMRAGIRVSALRVSGFVIGSTFAAAGGILAASRLQAVTQNAGGNDLLLLAIAGPVIGGVSLFGGRGSVWAALTGALVIGSISNGMDLLSLSSQAKYIVTGVVLVIAVAFDALARAQRRRQGLI